MLLEKLRLLLDSGLLVLIWMVQLVVYPGFLSYSKENLLSWHSSYTKRISYLVMPLMCLQLFVAFLQLFYGPGLYTVGSFMLLVVIWGITFMKFVPLHRELSLGVDPIHSAKRLVSLNRIRTFLWTAVFLWGLLVQL